MLLPTKRELAFFMAAIAAVLLVILTSRAYDYEVSKRQPYCVPGDQPKTYLCVKGSYVVQP